MGDTCFSARGAGVVRLRSRPCNCSRCHDGRTRTTGERMDGSSRHHDAFVSYRDLETRGSYRVAWHSWRHRAHYGGPLDTSGDDNIARTCDHDRNVHRNDRRSSIDATRAATGNSSNVYDAATVCHDVSRSSKHGTGQRPGARTSSARASIGTVSIFAGVLSLTRPIGRALVPSSSTSVMVRCLQFGQLRRTASLSPPPLPLLLPLQNGLCAAAAPPPSSRDARPTGDTVLDMEALLLPAGADGQGEEGEGEEFLLMFEASCLYLFILHLSAKWERGEWIWDS
ncbi:hypothetical protein K438DRAFT_1179725 [Mycena galopus ATCC 62051]|nr:hypothetical protein K438DRAFT_1179725 [Mycena galopus ATCC 62051]